MPLGARQTGTDQDKESIMKTFLKYVAQFLAVLLAGVAVIIWVNNIAEDDNADRDPAVITVQKSKADQWRAIVGSSYPDVVYGASSELIDDTGESVCETLDQGIALPIVLAATESAGYSSSEAAIITMASTKVYCPQHELAAHTYLGAE